MRNPKVFQLFTLSALLLGACQSAPTAAATLTPSPASTGTATLPPPTPTLAPPLAYVGGSVPCFAGPNVDRNIVSSVEIGDVPEILGRDSTGEYWIINRKDGNGYCWLESRYSTVVGSWDGIAVIAPTPTAAPPVPHAPHIVKWKAECRDQNWHLVAGRRVGDDRSVHAILDWDDVDGETGYRIYRRGELVAELEQGVTHYRGKIEDFQMASHRGSAEYAIEAFNATGPSIRSKVLIVYSCKV